MRGDIREEGKLLWRDFEDVQKRREEKMEEDEAIGDILSSSETKPQGARQFRGGKGR